MPSEVEALVRVRVRARARARAGARVRVRVRVGVRVRVRVRVEVRVTFSRQKGRSRSDAVALYQRLPALYATSSAVEPASSYRSGKPKTTRCAHMPTRHRLTFAVSAIA